MNLICNTEASMILQISPCTDPEVLVISVKSNENLLDGAKQTTSPAGFFESALPFDLSAVFCPEMAFFELDSASPLSAFFGC
jgi:hypothetical protein